MYLNSAIMSSTSFNNRKWDSRGFERIDELQAVNSKCESANEFKVKGNAVMNELKFKLMFVKQETVAETRYE